MHIIMQGGDTVRLRSLDASTIQQQVDDYFAACAADRTEYQLAKGGVSIRETPPSMVGLARFLHCSKETLYRYMSDPSKDEIPSLSAEERTIISDCLHDASDRVEEYTLAHSLQGDIDPKIAAMVLAGYGYRKEPADTTAAVKVYIQGADMQSSDAYSQ